MSLLFARRENLHKLLDLYYSKLSAKLKDLGYDPNDIYPVDEFKRDFEECRFFGCTSALMHTMVW